MLADDCECCRDVRVSVVLNERYLNLRVLK
jgi:hypothetical protein